MPQFNTNSSKTLILSQSLQRLTKKGFPRAVRHTLNELAYQDKQRIPTEASARFVTRNKTLFKSHTGFNKVGRGMDVNKMQSEVGLYHRKNEKVIEGLANQETGGVGRVNKTFAHEDNRIRGSRNRKVKGKGKYDKQQDYHNGNKAFNYRRRKRGGIASSFVAAAAGAIKANKNVFKLSSGRGGRYGTIYRIDRLYNTQKGRKLKIKVTKLYNYRKRKTRRFKQTNYLKESALHTHKSVYKIYKQKAEFQFRKELKI